MAEAKVWQGKTKTKTQDQKWRIASICRDPNGRGELGYTVMLTRGYGHITNHLRATTLDERCHPRICVALGRHSPELLLDTSRSKRHSLIPKWAA